MKIPFLNLFRKGKEAEPEKLAPAPAKLTAAAAPASSEKTTGAGRMSKTVMPTARTASAPEAAAQGLGTATATAVLDAPAPSAPPKIAFGITPPSGASPRVPSLQATGNGTTERLISLAVGDFLDRLPADMVNADNVDPNRRVSFKAAEVEKGMSTGRPAAPLSGIYAQAPELFNRLIADTDPADVLLPMTKVLEQFTKFQVRVDQIADDAVPQVETPFLKVTLEDNARFGIATPEVTSTVLPEIRVQPATAGSIAAAEPEPAPKERVAPIRIELPSLETTPVATPATPIQLAPADPVPTVPAPIAFSLSPNGADAPATETVPASAEPSVPTSFKLPPASAPAPTQIPFKIAPGVDDATPAPTPATTMPATRVRRTAGSPKIAPPAGQEISLSLRAVMQSLPAFQLNGDPDDVPSDVRITLPFALVEPQLILGRIAIAPAIFEAAIPEAYRDIFDANEATTPVALPLQEVLQNLPTASLNLRADQEEQESCNVFETAFSQKAKEDAERFNLPGSPVAKTAPVESEKEAAPVACNEPEIASDEPAAKTVVASFSALSDIAACAIIFSDGLSLAGNFPPELEAEGLCAMAPSLLKRVNDYTAETKLGSTDAITLFCGTAPVSFFMHENICLAALHAHGDLAPSTREQLASAVRGLARKYPQAA